MAQDLLAITHKILARAVPVLRPRLALTMIANKDYQGNAQEFGDTVDVPVPKIRTPRQVVPGPVALQPADRDREKVPVPLDQWYEDDFYLTDQELTNIDKDEHFVPMSMDETLDGLATQINKSLWELYYRIPYVHVGDSGTPTNSPFNGSVDVADEVATILNENRAPLSGRSLAITFKAEEDAKKVSDFRLADASGSTEGIREGMIGRKLGFDWMSDNDVPLHTAGDLASRTVSGAQAAGTTSLAVSGGTGTANQGDVITIAGQTNLVTGKPQTFSVQADEAGGVLQIEPGLQQAASGGEAIDELTDFRTSRQNLAMQRGCLTIASRSRKMSRQDQLAGRTFATQTDPITGMVYRLQLVAGHQQTHWLMDALWGRQVIRPELGVRILGKNT